MAVSSGIYTLTGVVLGGGVTWAAQWRLAARTDRLDARVAKRQVRAELRRIRQTPEFLTRHPNLHEFVSFDWPATTKWEAHSDRLARQLSDEAWDAADEAYEVFETLHFAVREGHTEIQDAAERTVARIDDALLHLG